MGQGEPVKLLIAIPIKSAPEYLERAAVCEATWLKDCPCDYAFFRDSSNSPRPASRNTWYLSLDETDPLIRQQRMKSMCQFALDRGYDFLFRVDADAFVWVNRLLSCGFEAHDYMGWCLEYSGWKERNRTAHGGSGFFLSRKAMQVVIEGKHFPHDGIYWGDIWTGQLLYDNGIKCHADRRFYEDINLTVPNLESAISIHPLSVEGMRKTYGL
jgi:hypothetical protein